MITSAGSPLPQYAARVQLRLGTRLISAFRFKFIACPLFPHLLLLLLRLDWHKASPSDIQKYRDMVSLNLSVLSSEASNCYSTDCSCHLELLDDYAHHLVHTLLDCACLCIPSHTTSSPRRLVGWKDGVSSLKEATNFWHKVWVEAGCPSSGVLFSIKKNAKSMPIDGSSVDSIFFYRKSSTLMHFLGK